VEAEGRAVLAATEAVMALAALEHSHLWNTYWTLQQRHAA